MTLRHNVEAGGCGRCFQIKPRSTINRKELKCPLCQSKPKPIHKRTNSLEARADLFKQRVKEYFGDEYIVIGPYKDWHTRVVVLQMM